MIEYILFTIVPFIGLALSMYNDEPSDPEYWRMREDEEGPEEEWDKSMDGYEDWNYLSGGI